MKFKRVKLKLKIKHEHKIVELTPYTWIKFFTPFVMGGVAALAAAILGGVWLEATILTLTYAFTPLGRFAILSAPFFGIPISLAVAAFIFIDFLTSLFIVWNFDLSTRIPFLGKIVLRFERKAHNYIQKKIWMQEVTFIAVLLFVLLPFLGTNAFIGSIIGHLLDMRPHHILIAVLIGSFIGALLLVSPVALLANFFS